MAIWKINQILKWLSLKKLIELVPLINIFIHSSSKKQYAYACQKEHTCIKYLRENIAHVILTNWLA